MDSQPSHGINNTPFHCKECHLIFTGRNIGTPQRCPGCHEWNTEVDGVLSELPAAAPIPYRPNNNPYTISTLIIMLQKALRENGDRTVAVRANRHYGTARMVYFDPREGQVLIDSDAPLK